MNGSEVSSHSSSIFGWYAVPSFCKYAVVFRRPPLHEAVDASPHPNESVEASHFDLNINWDGLPGDNKGIYGLFRGWLAKGLKGRTCS